MKKFATLALLLNIGVANAHTAGQIHFVGNIVAPTCQLAFSAESAATRSARVSAQSCATPHAPVATSSAAPHATWEARSRQLTDAAATLSGRDRLDEVVVMYD